MLWLFATDQGIFVNPGLHICGKSIPFAGDLDTISSTFQSTFHCWQIRLKERIVWKLEDLCHKLDSAQLLTRQRVKIYQFGMSLTDMATVIARLVNWVECNVETVATPYLKKWCHLAWSVHVSHLYVLHTSGGLQMPALSSILKSKIRYLSITCWFRQKMVEFNALLKKTSKPSQAKRLWNSTLLIIYKRETHLIYHKPQCNIGKGKKIITMMP